MNINYVRKQIKEAMDILGNMDITYNVPTLKSRLRRQGRLNEAFSILFDLDNLLKKEKEEDD